MLECCVVGRIVVIGQADIVLVEWPPLYLQVIPRLVAYSVAVAIFCVWLLWVEEQGAGLERFSEGALVERIQVLLAVMAGVLFAAGAYLRPGRRAILMALSGLTVVACVREHDALLDDVFPTIGWQGVAVPVLVIMGLLLRRRVKALLDQVGPFFASPPGMLAWFGFLMVVLVAQILIQGDSWERILDEQYNRQFKRAAEEMLESIGYLLILLAAIETLVDRRAAASRPANEGS